MIDASALAAFFKREIGSEVVRDRLEQGGVLMSSVNRTELKGKLVGAGLFTPREVDRRLLMFDQLLEVIPFDLEQSDLAAYYYARRNPYDLSLGDCACLALAEARGLDGGAILGEAARFADENNADSDVIEILKQIYHKMCYGKDRV